MSASYPLELTLKNILDVINPSREDWSIRFRIIDELRVVVQSVESLRGATVEPYGSFVSNLFTRWGDLDISIELPNGSYISAAGKKYKLSLLADVQRALRRRGGCHGLQFISHARVPILKFETNLLNISCDVSINNLSGQMKSKLLFWINEIDGRFREMVLLVKEWAKAHGINDSKTGSLNSYCLSLLVIYHFQTCQPPILPPLKDIYPGNMVEDLTGVRAVAEKRIEETCAVNINKFRSNRSRRINHGSLSELFISFIEKFCDISLRALSQGICTYNGQWEDIESNKIWLPKTYALYVEDPFEQPVNTARGVSSRQLIRISEAFQTSHQTLTATIQNPSSLIDTLVRLEVSHIMAKTSVGNPLGNNGIIYPAQLQRNHISNGMDHLRAHPQVYRNSHNNARDDLGVHPQSHRNPGYNGRDHLRIGPQVHRAGRAPSQVQQQPQSARVNRLPNNVISQRPVQATHSQVQQIWRPKSEN